MSNDREKEINIIIGDIILAVVIIITVILSFMQDKTLKIKNKEKTLGIITDIVDIRRRYGKNKNYYEGTIIAEYEVDGTKYYKKKRVISYIIFNSPHVSDYSIGDEIAIVYNKNLPSESAIDEIEEYEVVIYIVLTIEILILIRLLYKRLTKKKKLCLKVIAVDNIDYERERVFFEEKLSKELFFIDYDLGEEIKIGEIYELHNTYKNNYKKQIVLFNNHNVEAYSIVNINKDRFFKIR